MNPKTSIRLHFPYDNKWQLLPKIITKDEFKSIAYLEEGFYSLGLKKISPDMQSLSKKKKIKIRLTSDSSFDKIFDQLDFHEIIETDEEDMWPIFGSIILEKISNGLYEFNTILFGKFSLIYAKNIKTGEQLKIVAFEYYN